MSSIAAATTKSPAALKRNTEASWRRAVERCAIERRAAERGATIRRAAERRAPKCGLPKCSAVEEFRKLFIANRYLVSNILEPLTLSAVVRPSFTSMLMPSLIPVVMALRE